MFQIESLLAARLFISPKLVDGRLYFISNLSGRLSLYRMDYGGSVPEPLLPPNIALQNPHLIGGEPFVVLPKLGKILVMLDRDGNELYKPMLIPITGGFPEPVFEKELADSRVHLELAFPEKNTVFFGTDSEQEPIQVSYRANIGSGELVEIGRSAYGAVPLCATHDLTTTVLSDGYTVGDLVIYLSREGKNQSTFLYGIPLEERKSDEVVPLNGIGQVEFVDHEQGLLMTCAVFNDHYGLAYMDINAPGEVREVKVKGLTHTGEGELVGLSKSRAGYWLVEYNIDGCSWLYEGRYNAQTFEFEVTATLVGSRDPLCNGMLQSYSYDMHSDRVSVSFSRATSPTQIISIEGDHRDHVVLHTRECVLGIDPEVLSAGEDASFISHDGLRISARLYLPSDQLGLTSPRPVIFYIHGGPQSQERPDFAWFSMPLIQFLTLNGFAVFVPNVRGSTGYGLSYTKYVDRDWGGLDLKDHVYAFKYLAQDPRLDVTRAGVVGRSYGGYMTLMLAGTHPQLWSAAVDMFGPFDLLTFLDRIPETWKPYYKIALGDEVDDREFLIERSPKSHIGDIACPLLVIQGKNDPRVVEPESRDLVEYLRSNGKRVEYLMFENEGHDVLKYENRVRCYTAITDFFTTTLKP